MPCCPSRSGRTSPAARRPAPGRAGAVRPARRAPPRPGRPPRSCSRRKVNAVTRGMSTASTPTVRGVRSSASTPVSERRHGAAVPGALPAEGHRPRRSAPGRPRPRPRRRPRARRARGRAGSAVQLDRRLVGAVQAGGGASRQHDGAKPNGPRSSMSASVPRWSRAHRPGPGARRPRAGHQPCPAARADAGRRGPGGLPGGLRPRLRGARLRRRPVRRGARRPVRDRASPRRPRDRATTVVAGMFEAGPDPERPFNTLVMRGGRGRRTARCTCTTPSATASPTGSPPGAVEPARGRASPGFKVGLMTCYDLRFPELAGRWSTRAPRCWSSRPPGSPASGRSTTGGPWSGRAPSRTPCTSLAAGQPGPRYSGHSLVVDPLGDVLARGRRRRRRSSRRDLDAETLAAARRTNPSLANRRL